MTTRTPALRTLLVGALAAAVVLLGGTACTDSAPPAPVPSSATIAPKGETGGETRREPESRDTSRPRPEPSRSTTTSAPATGNYDPNRCPPGLLC